MTFSLLFERQLANASEGCVPKLGAIGLEKEEGAVGKVEMATKHSQITSLSCASQVKLC
jgi:hypothetical protein